jgi:hypothetical protein
MPGLGRNIGDAYIEVHASTGPFRRTLRAEAAAAGTEAGDEFDRRLGSRLGKLNIGLSRLKGSRNNFLNIVGSMADGLENVFGKAVRETFAGVGSAISGFGRTLADGEGPLAGFGKMLDSLGLSIGRLGGGGIDGLIIQLVALVLAFEAMISIAGVAAAGISTITGALTALAVAIGGGLLGGITALGPGLLALSVGATAAGFAIAGLSKSQKAALSPLKEWVKEIQGIANAQLFDGIGKQASTLADVLSTTLNPLISRSAGVLREFLDSFVSSIQGGQFAGVMATLSAQLPNLLRNLLGIASGLATGLAGVFAAAAPGANALFGAINRVVQSFAAWALSAEGVKTINTFMFQAIDVLSSLWGIAKQLGTTLSILWSEGASGGQTLLTAIQDILDRFNTWLGSTAGREALRQWFNTAVVVAGQLGGTIQRLIELFNTLDSPQTRAFFINLVSSINSGIGALTALVSWTQGALTAFLNFSTDGGNAILRFTNAVVSGFQSFMRTGTAALGAITRAVILMTANTGRLVGFWISSFKSFLGSVNSVAAGVTRAFILMTANMGRLVGFWISGFQSLVGAAGSAVNNVVVAFSNLQIRMLSVGRNIISGIISGISGAVGGLFSYVRGIADSIASTFAAALDIHSPSRVFREFGGFIILGLQDGMKRRARAAEKTSDTIARGVINSALDALNSAEGSIRATAARVFALLAGSSAGPALSKEFHTLGIRTVHALVNGLDDGRDEARGDIKKTIESISKIAQEAMKGEDKKTRASIVAQSRALQDWVRSQGQALDAVWREVDRAGARLDSARERLKDLQTQFNQLRDSTASSLRNELNLGSSVVGGETTFEEVAANVSGLAARMRTFARLLKRLVSAGLPAALVQEVASLGSTEGIAVARALMQGTAAQRRSLVADFGSLQQSTRGIGTLLADQMFGAGIEAQKGLIRGLTANQAALEKAAKHIARTIANKVREELGIHSPSTVFRQLGVFITEGLAQGIESGTARVRSAVTGLVDQNALSNLNPPISALSAQQTASGMRSGAAIGGIESGAIQIITPYANPALVAEQVMDRLAVAGK